ncbi:hypothetical protein VP1G_11077 [Cytospora mali]|uniref:Uncharacterized protein n=1 Tax=Cytospora mali TaxID=578113 RepID=A0A194V5T3_CYTMA|nr:hypothetical protein VP1G_11077 [Valsa mali var. pyri (nom. inval.)]
MRGVLFHDGGYKHKAGPREHLREKLDVEVEVMIPYSVLKDQVPPQLRRGALKIRGFAGL